ncbi:hypothetical protein GH733_007951, partial [Mirounga leonina]
MAELDVGQHCQVEHCRQRGDLAVLSRGRGRPGSHYAFTETGGGHRHQSDHECEKLEIPKPRMAATQKLTEETVIVRSSYGEDWPNSSYLFLQLEDLKLLQVVNVSMHIDSNVLNAYSTDVHLVAVLNCSVKETFANNSRGQLHNFFLMSFYGFLLTQLLASQEAQHRLWIYNDLHMPRRSEVYFFVLLLEGDII